MSTTAATATATEGTSFWTEGTEGTASDRFLQLLKGHLL